MVIIAPKCQGDCVISLFFYSKGIFSCDCSLNFINIITKFFHITTKEREICGFWII